MVKRAKACLMPGQPSTKIVKQKKHSKNESTFELFGNKYDLEYPNGPSVDINRVPYWYSASFL
jgi:hypothetical protein